MASAIRAGNGMPVLKASLTAKAPRGLDALARLGAELYAAAAAGDVLHSTVSHSFSQENGGYVMELAVPFAEKKDLAVEQLDDGVAVHLNGRRCVLTLPPEVRYREASSWSFEPPTLRVIFAR